MYVVIVLAFRPWGDRYPELSDEQWDLVVAEDLRRFREYRPERNYLCPPEAPEEIWERLGLRRTCREIAGGAGYPSIPLDNFRQVMAGEANWDKFLVASSGSDVNRAIASLREGRRVERLDLHPEWDRLNPGALERFAALRQLRLRVAEEKPPEPQTPVTWDDWNLIKPTRRKAE